MTATASSDWFALARVEDKIHRLPEALTTAFAVTDARREFMAARDVPVVLPTEMPTRAGLALREGRARLLHDLASIELQATELGLRTLMEFPDAPAEFRHELADIVEGECRHLRLCLNGLEALGYRWGDWPVHQGLWAAVGPMDSLLDRVLIVHRYLEGSGLDAGDAILRKLSGIADKAAKSVVETIVREEIDHVLFGSRWYRRLAEEACLDPERDFVTRLRCVAELMPRNERVAIELRRAAGFSEFEIGELEKLRSKHFARA